jgi:diguanylate cyclase (GGDEF)-like protein/PAS domain S-box-containing protein
MTDRQAHILVADDAPLTRGLLMQVLTKSGYRVKAVENGQQAFDYFKRHCPDLILMDADMPVLNGVAACARLRQLPEAKRLPIVIITAFVEREWIDRAYAAGATDYITKPLNWDVLRNRVHYILQAKQAEEALFREKEKAQITLASIGDGVITTDAQGQVEYLNPIATKLTGWQTQAAQGHPLSHVFSIIDDHSEQTIAFPVQRCLTEGCVIELPNNVALVHRKSGKKFAIESSAAPIKDCKNRIIGIVLVFHDVTDNRKMTQELAYKAKHDALTGLYNLHEFKLQLKHALYCLRHENTQHILLYMDLDRFKTVNDTCGHEAGDQLLKDIAFTLQKKIDTHTDFSKATLARLGGDEFGLLLENCPLSLALRMAEHLCEAIENFRFFWKNEQQTGIFTVGISIGVVTIATQTMHPKNVLAMADAACYTAKNTGRNCVHVYQASDVQPLGQNVHWVSLITENIDTNQGFSLFYQSIVPLDKAISERCYEILLRMEDEQGHLVLPGAFLSAATRYNLMPILDFWVIRTTLHWLVNHPQQVDLLTFCTINISGHSLADQDFLKSVVHYVSNIPIPANKLCWEISETTALTNFTGVLEFMKTFKKMGYRFVLDDFGSGLAAFNCLKDLPVDFLKIDGNFVKNIASDDVDHALVKAINDIAHLMQFRTIAEGVKNEIIFNKLKAIKTDYVQGYWLSQPQPLKAMRKET